MGNGNTSVGLLVDALEIERERYRELQGRIERAAAHIKADEAEMQTRSARMSDIERGIVTLGGQVPPEEYGGTTFSGYLLERAGCMPKDGGPRWPINAVMLDADNQNIALRAAPTDTGVGLFVLGGDSASADGVEGA